MVSLAELNNVGKYKTIDWGRGDVRPVPNNRPKGRYKENRASRLLTPKVPVRRSIHCISVEVYSLPHERLCLEKRKRHSLVQSRLFCCGHSEEHVYGHRGEYYGQ